MGGPRERFPAASRLRRSEEFQHAARAGRRLATPHFVVLVVRRGGGSEADTPRLGVTVSRRVGKAVVRNRVKRGIREWFRRARTAMDGSVDLVVIARPGAGKLGMKELSQELSEMLR